MNLKLIILAFIGLSVFSCGQKIDVFITDDNGNPVEKARVECNFVGFDESDDHQASSSTDAKGFVQISGKAKAYIWIDVEKEGYYPSKTNKLSKKEDLFLNIELKKRINPIPLFAKRLFIVPPVFDEQFWFDFEKGDFVSPHGKGEVKDIAIKAYFLRKENIYEDFHYKMEITFLNKNDAYIQLDKNKYSALSSPFQQSPEITEDLSYAKWLYERSRAPGSGEITTQNKNKCFYVRLRTKLDESGEIISCNYMKIYGDFPDVKYYFNPTPNDRNLEFDPKRNLFKNLDAGELVTEP